MKIPVLFWSEKVMKAYDLFAKESIKEASTAGREAAKEK